MKHKKKLYIILLLLIAGLFIPSCEFMYDKKNINQESVENESEYFSCMRGMQASSGSMNIAAFGIAYNWNIFDSTWVPEQWTWWLSGFNFPSHSKFFVEDPSTGYFNNSYRLTTLDVVAHGQECRIQFYKGLMTAFLSYNTGAEVAVFKAPYKVRYIADYEPVFWWIFTIGWTPVYAYEERWDPFIGKVPWANEHFFSTNPPFSAMIDGNWLNIQWMLINKLNGQVVLEFGYVDEKPGYSLTPKWWAGKWKINDYSLPKFSKDYKLVFKIYDRNWQKIAFGEWDGDNPIRTY